jgi:hypothetical protein
MLSGYFIENSIIKPNDNEKFGLMFELALALKLGLINLGF